MPKSCPLLENGSKQGCPCSSEFFITGMDPLLRMASATGLGWRRPEQKSVVMPGRPTTCGNNRSAGSDPSTAFVDDLSLVTSGPRAVMHARELVWLVVRWGRWAGITINLRKSRCIAIDFKTMTQVDTSSVRCSGEPIKALRPTEPFRHLGIQLTLSLDFQYEKARVLGETKKRIEIGRAHV